MFISGGGDSDVYAVMTRTGIKGLIFNRLQTLSVFINATHVCFDLVVFVMFFNKRVNLPVTKLFKKCFWVWFDLKFQRMSVG